jgi:hypothetical protein
MLAAVRPHSWDLPLFLHILGAMVLVGAVATAALLAFAAWRRPEVPVYGRAAFWSLLVVGVPGYVVMRVFAEVIRSDEHFDHNVPTWISLGSSIADGGLLLLLATAGFAFWWMRSGKAVAARTVSVLSSVYLVLLGVAWFAMTAKWG